MQCPDKAERSREQTSRRLFGPRPATSRGESRLSETSVLCVSGVSPEPSASILYMVVLPPLRSVWVKAISVPSGDQDGFQSVWKVYPARPPLLRLHSGEPRS